MTEELLSALTKDATPRVPHVEFIAEQPEHVKILVLKAENRSTKTISAITGYSEDHIRRVIRQPWFQEKYRTYIALSGNEYRMKIFEREFEDSLETLLHLRDNAKSETVRKDISIYLHDRIMGKVVQHVQTESRPQVDMETITEELSALAREKDELERQLAHEQSRMGIGTDPIRGGSPSFANN